MGNSISSISCHQPCCRWTTDVDGELAVEGKRLGKPGEEEPKMNFDTNVIGPANINLIGGGNGLQLQQELKLFEDSRFSRHPRDNSRGSPKAQTERDEPLPVAKASFDSPKSQEGLGSSRANPRSGAPAPLTQSAKQFADAFSREVLKIDQRNKPKASNPQPKFQPSSIRIMPTSAWSKLYAAFQVPVKPAAAPAESVQKALHSIVPAQWSSYHRHWTCQKTVAQMAIAEIAMEIPNSGHIVATLASTSLAKIAKKAITKEISVVLSSVSPAMWSPLHRKWCGHEAGQSSSIQKLVVAKNYGLLPGLASSMLDAALNIEVKVQAKVEAKAVKAVEALKGEVPAAVVCSVAPALYSKYHRHWTGGRAKP